MLLSRIFVRHTYPHHLHLTFSHIPAQTLALAQLRSRDFFCHRRTRRTRRRPTTINAPLQFPGLFRGFFHKRFILRDVIPEITKLIQAKAVPSILTYGSRQAREYSIPELLEFAPGLLAMARRISCDYSNIGECVGASIIEAMPSPDKPDNHQKWHVDNGLVNPFSITFFVTLGPISLNSGYTEIKHSSLSNCDTDTGDVLIFQAQQTVHRGRVNTTADVRTILLLTFRPK